MHEREYLCPKCTPNIITILAKYTDTLYLCPRCYTYFHVDKCISSNYTWMYIERDMEDKEIPILRLKNKKKKLKINFDLLKSKIKFEDIDSIRTLEKEILSIYINEILKKEIPSL